MKKNINILAIMTVAFLLIAGCKSTPGDVLPREEMAQLLADIHIGESIVDVERTKFYSDSLKKTVKQSILIEHNVTQEQLDTSFAWYGRNIEEYIAVYDRVIEIINDNITQLGSSIGEKVTVSLEGDSIDTWQGIRHYCFNENSPSHFISFSLPKDHYWEKGDIYIWNVKLINNISPMKWGIAADYTDGSSEYITSTTYNDGWNELTFVSDSTKSMNRVYGYINIVPKESEQTYLDSISLMRIRIDNKLYPQRSKQHKFEYGKNNNKKDNSKQSSNDDVINSDDEKSSTSPLREKSFLRRKNNAHNLINDKE